jgi:hypothetical protein
MLYSFEFDAPRWLDLRADAMNDDVDLHQYTPITT